MLGTSVKMLTMEIFWRVLSDHWLPPLFDFKFKIISSYIYHHSQSQNQKIFGYLKHLIIYEIRLNIFETSDYL